MKHKSTNCVKFFYLFRNEAMKPPPSLNPKVPPMLMPDLAFFFKSFTLSLHDDMAKNNQGSIVQVSVKLSDCTLCDLV